MEKNKTAKTLWIITLVFLIVVLLLSIAATVLMFMDSNYYYSYYSYYYGGMVSGYTIYHPSAGIMPCVGAVLLIVGLILFILSKKKPLIAIGTLCLVFLAQLLLSLSFLNIIGMDEGYIGWCIAVSAASIASVPFVLGIIYVVFSQIARKSGSKKPALSASYGRMAQNLREIKDLLDNGVFTQEEYEAEKAAIFKANGILVASGSILNGVYANLNSKIEISDSVFTMFYGDRVVKAGSIEKNGEKGLVLRSEDGKVLAFEISGSALVTKAGVRYEKE